MPLIDGTAARQIRRRLKRSVDQITAAVTEALDDDLMEPKTLFNIESGGGRVGCSWERTYALAEALGLDSPIPILVKDEDKQECSPIRPTASEQTAVGAA